MSPKTKNGMPKARKNRSAEAPERTESMAESRRREPRAQSAARGPGAATMAPADVRRSAGEQHSASKGRLGQKAPYGFTAV